MSGVDVVTHHGRVVPKKESANGRTNCNGKIVDRQKKSVRILLSVHGTLAGIRQRGSYRHDTKEQT